MSEHKTDPDVGIIGKDEMLPEGVMQFSLAENTEPVMVFKPDGTILIRGEKVDDNKEVYAAFRTWLRDASMAARYHGNPNPLIIEVHDTRNIVVLDGDKPLGCIQSVKFEAAADEIPPILEVEVPSVTESMSEEVKDSIANTIEAIQRHGGQVIFRDPSGFEMNTDGQEQVEAEKTLTAAFLPSKQ